MPRWQNLLVPGSVFKSLFNYPARFAYVLRFTSNQYVLSASTQIQWVLHRITKFQRRQRLCSTAGKRSSLNKIMGTYPLIAYNVIELILIDCHSPLKQRGIDLGLE